MEKLTYVIYSNFTYYLYNELKPEFIPYRLQKNNPD